MTVFTGVSSWLGKDELSDANRVATHQAERAAAHPELVGVGMDDDVRRTRRIGDPEAVDQPLLTGAHLDRLRRQLPHDEAVHVALVDPQLDDAVAGDARRETDPKRLGRGV